MMRSIRRSGFDCQVISAHSTSEAMAALEISEAFPAKDLVLPDVIFTDLRVGPHGGAELVTFIRNNPITKPIPIVVMSSAASEGQIHDLYLRGANSFIEKPLDSEEFGRTMQALVHYWGHLNSVERYSQGAGGRPYPL